MATRSSPRRAAADSLPDDYVAWLGQLKDEVQQARLRTSLAVNRELLLLYWRIGGSILQRQKAAGWGKKVVDRLANDLRQAFPDMAGFSPRNLMYMRAFAEAWPDEAIVQQAVAQLPWGHNLKLLEMLSDAETRTWYARAAVEHGWSRNVLVHQIETRLHERQGAALSNFHRTLPAQQSELAQQLLKDPYQFDFLTLGETARERELERTLLAHLKDFLVELGVGFAFVGSQYHLSVGGQDYYLDLLFYHLKLRCFIVVELKMDEFKPEYAGKMNFYLSVADEQLRQSSDAPTIGLILCKSKNGLIVEYALRESAKPIGVAEYVVHLTETLPDSLLGILPTAQQLESSLDDEA